MPTKLIVRALTTSACALLMLALARPALAQAGLKGRVLDEKGHAVSGVVIRATCTSIKNVQPEGGTTDSDGRFQFTGLHFGTWELVGQKGNMIAKAKEASFNLLPNQMVDAGDLTLRLATAADGPAPKTTAAPKGMSAEEAKARNEKTAAMQAKFKGANDDLAAGKFDDAITKLTAVAKDVEKDTQNSASVAAKLGEVYMKKAETDTAEDAKKSDIDSAEKSFQAAIGFDPNMADAYNALANIYNGQQKFDDALKMSQKANELSSAAGATGNPGAIFNQAVVLWNSGKGAEAEPLFKKVTELDPKNAEAFYLLGIAQVNQGEIKDAVASLKQYLKLAPTGQNAQSAKDMLAAIDK